jgi:tape measure domain-containing protein
MEGGNPNMTIVDKRVVEMQFDNGQFESGVHTSVNSLDKLKSSLNLDASANSLSNLNEVGKNFSLAGISQGVDALVSKFSTLGIIGITVLQNMTNAALNLGGRMVSAVIDPILQGGKARAENIEQAKFQFKGLGMDVTASMASALDAVKGTAYGLDAAAKVASQLGASGIKAGKQMTSSLRGVAGVAAMTSRSYEDIGMIFTTVAGNGRLMGEQLMQLSSSGINAAAVLAKYLHKTEAEVRDMTSKGQISFQMFSDAMDDAFGQHAKDANQLYSGALDNVHAALSRLGADIETPKLEQMRKIFNALIPIIDNVHESLMPLINDFGNVITAITDVEIIKLNNLDLSPIVPVVKSIENVFNGLKSILKPVTEAFSEIFPPIRSSQILAMAYELQILTEKFKMGEQTADGVKRSFAGVFAVLDIGKMAFMAIAKGLNELIIYLQPAAEGVLSFSGSVGDMFVSLDNVLKTSDAFNKIIKTIGDILKPFANGLKKIVETIKTSVDSIGQINTNGVTTFGNNMAAGFNPIIAFGTLVGKIFDGIANVIKKVIPVLSNLGKDLGRVFTQISQNISSPFSDPGIKRMSEIVNGGLFVAIVAGLNKFVGILLTIMRDIKAGGFGSIMGILDNVRGCLFQYQQQLKADILKTLAEAIAILAASLLLLSTIDPQKLAGSLAALGGLFTELMMSMSMLTKLTGVTSAIPIIALSIAMSGLSIALLLLSFALVKLSKLHWEEIGKGLYGIAGMAAILLVSAKMLAKNTGPLVTSAIGLVIFAGALYILAMSVEKLGKLNTHELAKGLLSIAILVGELILFLKYAKLDDKSLVTGLGLMALAGALFILAKAVGMFATLDSGQMMKGLISVGVILGELSAFTHFTADAKDVISTAIGLTVIAAAMLIFAKAVKSMGDLQGDEIGKGLFAMAGVLTAVTIAIRSLPTDTLVKSIGLVAIGGALVILAKALQMMASMSWEQIARGLIALAGSLAIIALALDAMELALPGAAALLVVSAALIPLAVALKMFGDLSMGEIGKGLLALGGALLVLAVGGVALTPAIVPLLGFAGAVALLGIGVLAIGVGLLAFSAGLAALAITGAAGSAALISLGKSLIDLIPSLFKALGAAIISFAEVIATGGPQLTAAFVTLITSLCNAIIQLAPMLITTLMTVISTLLDAIVQNGPKFLDAGMQIIVAFLKGIADHIGDITTNAIQIVVNFIEAVTGQLPSIIQAGADLILAFINGVANALRGDTPALVEAMKLLIGAMITAGVIVITGGTTLTDFETAGSQVIAGFVKGIKDGFKDVIAAGGELASAALTAAKNILEQKSPSKAFERIGKYSVMGFVQGLSNLAGVVETTKKMGTIVMSALSGSVGNISDIIQGEVGLNPTIRPVLDLTDVHDGLNSTFGQTQGFTLATANQNVSSISRTMGQNNKTGTPEQPNQNGTQKVVHSGKITVEGVNNKGELVAVVDKTFDQNDRRVPARVATLPSMI